MARTLLGEIAHQIFNTPTPKRNNRHNNRSSNKANDYYERVMFKMKQSAFENKKAYEIMKHKAKSKGWI